MLRLIVTCFIVGVGVSGQSTEQTRPDDSSLQHIVKTSAATYAEAYARKDSAAIGNLFTAEAEYVNADGTVFHGRGAIERELAARFEQSSPGIMSTEILSIRPIAKGIVTEEGISTFSSEGDPSVSQSRYTAIHVQQADGVWRLASVRELSLDESSPHDHLLQFQWLLGEWREDVGGQEIATTWDWSDDENYLIGKFTIQSSDDVRWTGIHRIAWDPDRKQFRSWIFESQGGFREGWWQESDGGDWSAHISGTDNDGTRHSSTTTFQLDGEDAIVVLQKQRLIDGQSVPDSAHRIVRRPPEPGQLAPSEATPTATEESLEN